MEELRLTDGRLKIRHLALADALNTHGSLVAAAADLHVSQPALTRTLRELETILGVELFERHARGVAPTIFGSAFTQYARRILASLSQASRHLAELTDARAGTVTVGVESFGGHTLVASATTRMKAEHPHVTIMVLENSAGPLLDGVETGRLDCAVGCFADVRLRTDLTLRQHYREPIALVARRGHYALRRSSVALRELADLPWVLPAPPSRVRVQMDLAFEKAGMSLPANRVETDSPSSLVALVTAGDAVGALPLSVAKSESRMRVLGPDLDIATVHIGVVTPADGPTGPALRAFVRALHDAAADVLTADKPT